MLGLDLHRFFMEPGYSAWFWLLVPLILLYLIRPKPVDQTIPSLMFLLQDKGRAFRNSFLRYLYKDFVFFLQLLIMTLLIAAACEPFITVSKDTLVGNAVIVLDASASMHTSDRRWDDALDAAKDSLARQNTIILVMNRPVILGRELSKGEAMEVLNGLQPSDTETNIFAAIMAAREFAPNADSIVTVISDFRNSDAQQDYTAAIRTVQATGATVKLEQVGTQVKNVGIVSMQVQDEKTRIGITNFQTDAVVVTLNAGSVKQDVPLGPGSTDFVTINTPPGLTKVSISPNDDFMLDNEVTIANNLDLQENVLIITNNPKIQQTPLWFALQSINDKTSLDLAITVSNPPQLVTVNQDLVIFADVNSQLLVQRVVRDTATHVAQGGAAVIMYQPDLFSIDFEGMLPVEYKGPGGTTAITAGEFSPIVKDVDFGEVTRYHQVATKGRVLAQAAADGSPIVSLIPDGQGLVLYYGIDDTASSFPQDPYYPVFWKRVLDSLGGREGLGELNLGTGATPLAKPTKTPGDFTFQGFLDKQGVYTFPDRIVAANLLSSQESDVSVQPLSAKIEAAVASQAAQQEKQKDLTTLAILAALALLFLELFIVKFRGDF